MSETLVNDRLAALTAAGTSVWLDQLRRGMVVSGELQRLIDEDSLRGVTSNPAIFEKAILGSADYDEELTAAAREGLSPRDAYRRLALADVQMAAGVLRPIFEQSDGLDGYVCLEVAPRLAHDTEGTLEQVRRYWKLVDRPNVMLSIPATDEGIPAIETALYEGSNVNATLLFAVSRLDRVMAAFISAMERRQAEGKPLNVHSVASFFLSRVDTEVDKRLEDAGRDDLMGRAGLANARAAYAAFQQAFAGERFAALREAGCPVQRPLWASTGVKSSRYSETMYVDGLVGPDSAITMPQPTLLAAGSAGEIDAPTVELDPAPDLEALASAGIDLDEVTDLLLDEGVRQFADAMETLYDGIEHRRQAAVPGRPTTIEANLPADAEEPVAETVRRAGAENVARRIWERDGTLWAPEGTPEVDNRLGWLTIADKVAEDLDSLAAFVDEVHADGYTDAVLLGMGGSSLAPEVFRRSHSAEDDDGLRLHVLDTTEPLQVLAVEDAIDPERTLFIVSSKSGGTIEPNSLFAHFWALRPDGRQFVAVTDPDTSLGALAGEHEFRRTFVNHPDIGGRYSALSWFGVVPAALAGIDVEGQLHAAEVAEQNCQHWQTPDENSGLWLGCVLGALAGFGRDKLAFVIDAPIEAFGLWVEQLIAESTGKDGKGVLPIADEPLCAPEAYGDDRVFVHVRNADHPDAEHEEAVAGLAAAGHPTITVGAHGAADLGRLFFHSEFATAVAGWTMGINPFDQPNVQEAKDNTSRVLTEGAPEDLQDGDLAELLDDLSAPQYVAIMGYLPYDDGIDAAVSRLRAALIARHGVATTWGYGPRFLHSTGQYHKGGPKTGRFLQLVHDDPVDADVPGQAFGFRQLISAQADGDLETLRHHGLPAVRVRLSADDLAGSIDRITASI